MIIITKINKVHLCLRHLQTMTARMLLCLGMIAPVAPRWDYKYIWRLLLICTVSSVKTIVTPQIVNWFDGPARKLDPELSPLSITLPELLELGKLYCCCWRCSNPVGLNTALVPLAGMLTWGSSRSIDSSKTKKFRLDRPSPFWYDNCRCCSCIVSWRCWSWSIWSRSAGESCRAVLVSSAACRGVKVSCILFTNRCAGVRRPWFSMKMLSPLGALCWDGCCDWCIAEMGCGCCCCCCCCKNICCCRWRWISNKRCWWW